MVFIVCAFHFLCVSVLPLLCTWTRIFSDVHELAPFFGEAWLILPCHVCLSNIRFSNKSFQSFLQTHSMLAGHEANEDPPFATQNSSLFVRVSCRLSYFLRSDGRRDVTCPCISCFLQRCTHVILADFLACPRRRFHCSRDSGLAQQQTALALKPVHGRDFVEGWQIPELPWFKRKMQTGHGFPGLFRLRGSPLIMVTLARSGFRRSLMTRPYAGMRRTRRSTLRSRIRKTRRH